MAELPFAAPSLKSSLKAIYPMIHFIKYFRLPSTRLFRLGLITLSVLMAFSFSISYFYVLRDLPSASSLTNQPVPQTTHIRDRNGIELYKIYSSQNRTLIKISDLPPHVIQATIAIEDKNFFQHRGFSLKGFSRAAWRIIHNDRLEGGSTITQQLVKTSLLSPERTLRRKLRELILSLAVEAKYSKEQILEMYLNRVSFGGSAYGIEEAAQTYFGVSAKSLTLAQAAILAGLPAAPTTYSPYGPHPELAKSRQKDVLSQMVQTGSISWNQAEEASAQELVFKPPATNIKAPHFVMYVKELLSQKYGAQAVEQGGLDVVTSLDLSTQEAVQKIVATETAKVAYLHIKNGAALVTNPRTGEILAMIGSRDYFDTKNDGFVNVVLNARQPGSSIKPINYALAFTRGFSPASIIDDSPITYKIPGQPPYSPINYDHRYHGRVTLRTALASSYNIPAVKLLSANGINNMIELAQKMGISTWTDSSRFGLSLTLGGGEVTMLDLAQAYGVFANQGRRISLQPILSVKDSQGKIIEEFICGEQVKTAGTDNQSVQAAADKYSCQGTPILSPDVAYLVTDILSDNSARTPAFGPNSQLNIPDRQVAVKTGTTNSLRDNWTIGYTPNILAAVWVGNNDNSPMSYVASGVTGASPIWRRIMDYTLEHYPQTLSFAPGGLLKVSICPLTGTLACGACAGKTEYFVPGTEPKNACSDEQINKLRESKSDAVTPAASSTSTLLSPTPKPIQKKPTPLPNRRFRRR